jgi:pyridoxine 4-dehydrogenase
MQSSDLLRSAVLHSGLFALPKTNIALRRMGYGAMQLAGPGVFGPPRDRAAALSVLRAALDAGVNHIDTSDFYGPHVTNQIICEALHPYPKDLTIVTKVGARRGPDGAWIPDLSRQNLVDSVHANLRNLSLDALHVVNLRVPGAGLGPAEGALAEPLAVLIELKQQGLIRHLGLSNVTPTQFAEAQSMTEIVCVQNMYNVAHREDDEFIDRLAQQGVAYVPFFPLGGFKPLQSSTLQETADELNATPMQLALAWLLQRAKNILLIPGTASLNHLAENLQAAALELASETIAKLNGIAALSEWRIEAPTSGSGLDL